MPVLDTSSSSSRIKVLFCADILIRDFDGASRTMYQLIDRIPRDRFDFLFVTGMAPKEDIGYPVVKTPNITAPINTTYKIALPALARRRVQAAIDDFDPDIIHIASPSPLGNFVHQWNRSKDRKVITIYHTHFLSYIQYYLHRLPFLVDYATKQVAASQRRFYSKADLIYIPTLQMSTELRAHDFDTSTMKLWQRGLNHTVFHPGRKDRAAMTNIVGNELPTIIFASRLVWEKNLSTLINIYKALEARDMPYNMVIAGDGVARATLEAKMPRARFLGTVDHETLAMLYASSDVFVFPSISETYGNVVVEAMACGCPAVIARGGGSQSLVEDGVTGYLCEPDDSDAYVSKIDELISSPTLGASMSRAGLDYTRGLDWEVLASTYFSDVEKLYKNQPITDLVDDA